MRRRLELLIVVVLLAAGLVVAEKQRIAVPASAQSILFFVADSERDLTRMPSHFTRLSDSEEIRLGSEIADHFLAARSNMTGDDRVVEACVAAVGGRIAPHAHRRLPLRFHYIPERDFVNAFALPGGHVFIGAGLLEHMTTEDQLAAVLAHEVEHVDHFHCAERLQVEAALRKVPLARALGIPIAVFQAGYSKEQELEADREGVLLAASSGYSASGALQLFEVMARLYDQVERAPRTPQQELAEVTIGALSGYFRSHPLTAERIAQVRGMIARQPSLAANPQRTLSIAYVILSWQSLDAVAKEKFDMAVDLASRALASKPDYAPAFEALAEGEYGRGRLSEGQNAYRAALAIDPTAADRVESWVEGRASKLSDQKMYDREIALVDNVLTLQRSQPRLLRLRALAESQRGNFEAARSTATEIRRLYPDAAESLGGEMQREAETFLASREFGRAASISRIVLVLKPVSPPALQTLADAEFAQAHFAEAATACQEMFDAQTADVAWLRSFADAAGAARPDLAAQQLSSLLSDQKAPNLPAAAVQVEAAGLALMAGDDAAARALREQVDAGTIAPEFLGRLGWWYFRARRIADAAAVLNRAQSLRPGDAEIQNTVGWLALEQGSPVAALAATADTVASESRLHNTRDVRNALAEWQQRRSAEAIRHWTDVTRDKPQWRDPVWRSALYPPRINAIAQQLEAERQRRAAMPARADSMRRRPASPARAQ